MNNSPVTNTSFLHFLDENAIRHPTAYRVGIKNKSAGMISLAKYDKPGMPVLDEDVFCLSKEWTIQHFYPYMCGSRVLSQAEAIAQADANASSGYPWNLKYSTKKKFFESDSSRVVEDWWRVISGEDAEFERIVPIWLNCQKVELRTLEKLAENSLRTYLASPTEHAVCANRLCLDMNEKFYASNNRTWSFVGATKYLSGWDSLYRRLDKHPNAYELDESQYDSSLFTRLMWDLVEIRENFWRVEDRTPLNRRRLARIYESNIHTVVALETSELVQKHTGNPSGSSNTIVDNSLNLFRLLAYAWILLCKKQGKEPVYNEFMAEVEAALNGDDNTFTCSDAVNGWFNATTISEVWSSIGVTTKSPDFAARKLRDVRFLSQGFAFDDKVGIWFPVPETEKILCSLAYKAGVDDVRWHLLRANALRLDSYGNKEVRVILTKYIEYLLLNYMDEMFGEIKPPHACDGESKIPVVEIINMWRSDSWIEAMYSGKESIDGAKTGGPSSGIDLKARFHSYNNLFTCP